MRWGAGHRSSEPGVTLESFKRASNFGALKETDKVCYLAFFHLKTSNTQSFDVAQAAKWLVEAGGSCAQPASTRR